MLRCAVGRSFCTEDEPRRGGKAAAIPTGYDSVCFPGEAEMVRLRTILEKEPDQSAPDGASAFWGGHGKEGHFPLTVRSFSLPAARVICRGTWPRPCRC